MYGLKGNIDATVQVACREQGIEKNLVVPLELKTGRRDTNQAHRAQTALYTLLLSDRYGKSLYARNNLPSTIC
jgi:DNA replication ATP-dependent helicase Dna2